MQTFTAPKFQSKVTQDSNPYCRINPDPYLDVRQISQKKSCDLITLSASVISSNFVKIGQWLYNQIKFIS